MSIEPITVATPLITLVASLILSTDETVFAIPAIVTLSADTSFIALLTVVAIPAILAVAIVCFDILPVTVDIPVISLVVSFIIFAEEETLAVPLTTLTPFVSIVQTALTLDTPCIVAVAF